VSNVPSLPDMAAGLALALKKASERAQEFRDKYGAVVDPPDEFLGAVLPALESAVNDPEYALKLAAQAWADILAGHAGYNPHHGGLN